MCNLQSVKCQLQAKLITWEWKLHVYPWSLINVAIKFRIDFFTENIWETLTQRSVVPGNCFLTAGKPRAGLEVSFWQQKMCAEDGSHDSWALRIVITWKFIFWIRNLEKDRFFFSLNISFIPLLNMTHAAPSFPFFPLWQQTQHHRERRSGCHV